MLAAKKQGKNRVQMFTADMQTAASERLALESELHRALERNELLVHYQPLFDLQRPASSGRKLYRAGRVRNSAACRRPSSFRLPRRAGSLHCAHRRLGPSPGMLRGAVMAGSRPRRRSGGRQCFRMSVYARKSGRDGRASARRRGCGRILPDRFCANNQNTARNVRQNTGERDDGRLCDGSGSSCTPGGVANSGDTIAKVGDVAADLGRLDLDVHGQVIAPGFIDMMSAETGLFADGRGQSDLRQGVTLEIFGEGESMGPINDQMRAEQEHDQSDIKYSITWHTLNEGLDTLAGRGISPKPSRPGESHPEALTDPDVSLSTYPARATR
jgi:hypothetical protein